MSKNKKGIWKNRYIKKLARTKKAIDLLGGKCNRCDESHIAALSFHHIDPKNKKNEVANLLKYNDWEAIEIEIRNCILLCENCHRKEHFDHESYKLYYSEICKKASGIKLDGEINIKRWTNEENQKLIEMYKSNKNIFEISTNMHRMPATIKTRIKKMLLEGILTQRDESKVARKSRTIINKEIIQNIMYLKRNKHTNLEISEKLKISVDHISKLIKENQCPHHDVSLCASPVFP